MFCTECRGNRICQHIMYKIAAQLADNACQTMLWPSNKILFHNKNLVDDMVARPTSTPIHNTHSQPHSDINCWLYI